MKDRKDIIDSGMLEQYLLGELPNEQALMLEKQLASDPELKAYYDTIEENLEQMAFENAVVPPSDIKNALMDAVNDASTIKDITASNTTNRSNLSKFLAIAAGFSLIFLLSSLWLYTEWNSNKNELNLTQEKVLSQQEQIAALEAELKTSELLAIILKDPNTEQFSLKTNKRLPGGKAVAYINHENQYAVVNPQKLPPLLENRTYQMWADVNGEMINMGVIDKEKDVVVLEYIPDATSLNITVEPAGGSEHATVEQLVSNVYL